MKASFARYAVAAILVAFAWKGSELSISWPPAMAPAIKAPQPAPELLAWSIPLKEYLPKITPKDRQYLAHFYDAMAFVILRDGDRSDPIVSDTDKFAAFHAGSLRLAVDKSDVGKYGELGAAIDEVFVKAVGADVQKVDDKVRGRLVAACGVLSWAFTIHGE